MSIWVPKRDKAGRWHYYSIGIPFQLLLMLISLSVLLLLLILG